MQLKIIHRTEYRYESPVRYSIQELRLSPISTAGQEVEKWHIQTPIKANLALDAFQNSCSTFVQDNPYTSMIIEAAGIVKTSAAYEFQDANKAVSPYYLLQQTRLTEPTAEMLDFFATDLPRNNSPEAILNLASAVQQAITYIPGSTNFASLAAQSFAMKAGVCQDHSHILLGLCRASHIPARYVSGYFFTEDSPDLASHAWIDVCIDIEQGKWLSVDTTHACFSDARHIRLALGRDYYSAAPVKGVRSGGGEEALTATISIQQLS